MQKLDYSVTTCRRFYTRHDHIFRIHGTYLSSYFNFPRLHLEHDISAGLPFSCGLYRPSLWFDHLSVSYPIHAWNCYIGSQLRQFQMDAGTTEEISRFSEFLALNEMEILFPMRHLKQEEHSLLHKHFFALKRAADICSPLMIIEDDIVVTKDQSSIRLLKNHIRYQLRGNVGFTNLISNVRNGSSFSFVKRKKAVTFTTCAYVVTPEVARILVDGFFPYCLPIDFHLQYLLTKYEISGYNANNSCFGNGSTDGFCASSIQ